MTWFVFCFIYNKTPVLCLLKDQYIKFMNVVYMISQREGHLDIACDKVMSISFIQKKRELIRKENISRVRLTKVRYLQNTLTTLSTCLFNDNIFYVFKINTSILSNTYKVNIFRHFSSLYFRNTSILIFNLKKND